MHFSSDGSWLRARRTGGESSVRAAHEAEEEQRHHRQAALQQRRLQRHRELKIQFVTMIGPVITFSKTIFCRSLAVRVCRARPDCSQRRREVHTVQLCVLCQGRPGV